MNSLRGPRLAQVSSLWKFLNRSCTNSTAQPQKADDGSSVARKAYWHKIRPDKIVRDFDEIPGPRFLPIFGHEWRYNKYIGQYNRRKIHHTFKKLFDQYGYVVREHIGRKRVIVHLFHEQDIKEVYNNDGNYPSRISNRIMERYRRERPHEYDSAGLGPSNGKEWDKFRSQFIKAPRAFLKFDQEGNLEKLANDLVVKVVSGLDKDGEVDIMPDFFRWTLEGVGVVTLSRRLGCLDAIPNPEADKLIAAAETTNDCIYLTETSPRQWEKQYKRLVPAQDYFSSVVRTYIDRVVVQRNQFMETLLTPTINLKDLYTFVLDLFQAGIHTTAVTAAFALYHLARNPSVQQELRAQLKMALPTKDALYSKCETGKLKLLDIIISETLRMNPPTIGNGRILAVPLTLGGYAIPEGTMVLLHHMTASRLEENFIAPHLFKPERFAPLNSPHYCPVFRKKTEFASKPFGSGRRGCMGSILAKAQIKLAIVKFVRNYEISYHHEDIDTINRLHNEPDGPMKLRFKPVVD